MKRKHQTEYARRGIGNGPLFAIAGVMLLGGLFLSIQLFSGNTQSDWMKLQAQALSRTLSGQVLGVFDERPNLPEAVQIPILMYHHVGYIPKGSENDRLRADLTVSPEDFEMQVAWLKSQGANSITLGELYRYTEGKFTLPENPVVFTFDDGYQDVFDYAAPILKKYGYRGSVAVITQFSGITYGTNQYASWDTVRKAQREGVEIVSHTQDHFDGTNPMNDDKFILRNLSDSLADIKANAGVAPEPVLVYPFGHYDQRYVTLARQAGYKLGLTTNPGKRVEMKNLMEIPRIRIHGKQDFEKFKRLILE